MRQFYFFCLLVSLVFIVGRSNAQIQHDFDREDKVKVLTAKKTIFPVPFSDFVNLSRNVGRADDNVWGSISREAGRDSNANISFTHLRKPMPLFTLNWDSPTMVVPAMLPVDDEMDEGIPRRWHTYEEFKHEFLALKLPDTKTARLSAYLSVMSQEVYLGNPKLAGVGFGEDWYHMQKRKLTEHLVATGRIRMAEEKLSPAAVMRQVSCSEQSACEFLQWLKADTEYVIAARDYDLLAYVKEKYEVWCHIFHKC